jgi:IS5 family transposase
MTKELRKELYRTQFDLSNKFPEKPIETADLNEEIEYSKKLIEAVRQAVEEKGNKKAKNAMSRISELLESEKIKEIQSLTDEDAKTGHKSEQNHFFGYKSHIAMTEERIITGLEITTGEADDGKQLQKIVEQSKSSGVVVEEICTDMAYPSKDNLAYAKKNGIKMIAKLNPVISNGKSRAAEGFIFNKDADTFQCPAGHLAKSKRINGKKDVGTNRKLTYDFDISKCKNCPYRNGCYKEGAKSKTYSVTIVSETHMEQKAFQETEYFKERAKQRYMIEAKNAEMKQAHGLGTADSTGLVAMRLQSYFTAFVVNAKRIVKLLEPSIA